MMVATGKCEECGKLVGSCARFCGQCRLRMDYQAAVISAEKRAQEADLASHSPRPGETAMKLSATITQELCTVHVNGEWCSIEKEEREANADGSFSVRLRCQTPQRVRFRVEYTLERPR